MSALAVQTIADFNQPAYDAALRTASIRAQHSFFDQHIVEDEEAGFIAIDEGDYNGLIQELIDRVVHTIAGQMADDFDLPDYARATHIAAGIDLDFDADDCPF
jgi:hypothetical protein